MTQTAPRRSCKCGLHRSATMSDWLSTSVAAQAAPSPADLSHPKSVAKESEADVHPSLQPSFKLLVMNREGSRVHKKHRQVTDRTSATEKHRQFTERQRRMTGRRIRAWRRRVT